MNNSSIFAKHAPITIIERLIFSAGIYVLFLGCYTFVNRLIPLETALNFTTGIDHGIPFIPEFIFPFYLLYIMIVTPAFLIHDKKLFLNTAKAFSTLIIVSVLLFFILPVHVPRPDFNPYSISEKLLATIYMNDRPVCGFPSLHVSASLLAAIAVYHQNKTGGIILFIMFIFTALATLFIKQHVVIDVAGGILMAMAMDYLFLQEKTFNLRSYLRTASFLGKSTYKGNGKEDKNISSPKKTETSVQYDLYEPENPTGKTFIVVHGLTLQGNKDARLTHFSKTLSDFGIRVAAIFLPALTKCRFEEKDVSAIQDLAKELSQTYDSKVGIIAFSFGAGLSLVAASKKESAHIMGPMILFGAYYDLSDVFEKIIRQINTEPAKQNAWDNYIWFKSVLAYRNLNDLPLDPGKKKDLETFLLHYCHESSLERKRRFYKDVLENINFSDLKNKKFDSEQFESVSPANRLETITADIILIHDYFDDLVDPCHSEWIFEKISKNNPANNHQLLVTPLLSHVTPRTFTRVFDIFRLIRILSVIFK